MQENPQYMPDYDDEIDLFELFQTLWSGKWWILLTTMLSAGGAVGISLQLPNIYVVEAKIAPVSGEGGGVSQLMAQYGGLASLAGISLPSSSGSEADLLLEIMQSRAFVGDFIERHGLAPRLVALKTYDPSTLSDALDPEVYDAATGQWVRVVEPPRGAEPSRQELYEAFSGALNVSVAKGSTVKNLSFEHQSPVLGAEVLTLLIQDIDDYARAKDRTQSESSIAYLEAKLEETRLVDLQNVLYQMIESQTKTLMLAEVNPDYAFRVIDPPIVPELKSKPKRSLIVVIATLAGGMVGVLFVLIRSAIRHRRERLAGAA
ncbi:MAG: Wzz/FepE/Etk N-terminal domain-containing protein [Litorivicinaceae bacterium]|jgi:uncharacterized protein involved in exopolysaccharide biosynthesis|nr:Wzz/FepE/Etk N-terminal domain-containing protein [Litorivicinaceae bacterium]MDP5342762.1 Wzz/FepE/Etk N-terminal domain-containing protein [Litorivicinaceae bacterium]